jgi:hypothetical protein
MDCFTGADGGVSFVNLRILLEGMENEDTQTANAVLDIMRKFSRLIDVANKQR